MVCWTNLKRKKSVVISMCLLTLPPTALFNVGLAFLTGINRSHNQENDWPNGPHCQVRFYGNEHKEEYLGCLQKDDRVSQAEAEDATMMDMCVLPQGGTLSIIYRNLETEREIRGYEIRHLADMPKEKAVYIPVYMKSMGYQSGSELKLVFKKQEYTFQVAGYMTSTWLGSFISSLVDFYISQKAYEELYAQVGCGKLMPVRVKDTSQLAEFRKDSKRDTSIKIETVSLDAGVIETHLDEVRTACIMLVAILSVILFAFFPIIVSAGMVVMRFRVASHIDTQMRNTGVLGATGYTGKQITWSIALKFLVTGLAGTLLGIAVSYGMIGMLGKLIVESAGTPWDGGAQVGNALVSAIIMMAVILVISQTAAGKMARIRSIQALRGGLEPCDFLKSYFSLERTPGNLSLVLGLKNTMFHKKTYAMVGMIMAGVTFACVLTLVLYQNMGMDDRVLVEMSGFEISELMVYKAPHAGIKKLEEELLVVDGVRKTSMHEISSVSIEEETISAYASDDLGELEMMKPYEEEFPVYDNEIGLTGVLTKQPGKKIEDTLEVEYQGVEVEYIISGLGQIVSNFEQQCLLNADGLGRANPPYERNSILVYPEGGYDITEMIDVLENRFDVLPPSGSREKDRRADAKRKAEEKLANLVSMYGVDSVQFVLMRDGEIVLSGDTSSYQIDRIESTEEMFASNINSVAAVVSTVPVIILLGTMLIITLVFYIAIKSMIIRRKHEFRIFEAVGYTDRQLMQQVTASSLLVLVTGAAAGCTVSTVAVNPIASRLFEQVGISRMDFVTNPPVPIVVSMALVLFTFLISVGVAGKIKRILVYSSLTEDQEMKDENVENGKGAGGMIRRKDRISDGSGVGRYDGDGARICAKNRVRIGAGVPMAVAMMGQMGTAVWAETASDKAAQAQTVICGIGSTSKVVATAAVMKLVEDGLMDLDASLTEHIPEFEMVDERYVRTTPRMLLDHSSGVQGSTLMNAMLLGDNDTDNRDNLLRRLRFQRLKVGPGAFSAYCNDGFTLTEILVERVSKRTYTEFLKETFAKSLGLSSIRTPQNVEDMGRLAPVYDRQTGRELLGEMANVTGSGGAYATAEDLCRFSQVFMDGRSGAGDMLSDASSREMETSKYGKQMNPEERDINLMHGLGWNSVDTFPFSQYGVKTLIKGGDTSSYHVSLTVLPEENISCAVLSSDGGSAHCQMTVQEVLLEYLEEIGEIERHDENPFRETDGASAASQVLAKLLEKSGWYGGWDMFRAEVEADGTLMLGNAGSNVSSAQAYRYGDDGRFYGEFGAYINPSGDMSRESNGIIGKTALEFKIGGQGQQYLMAVSYEIYPGPGSTAMYLPLAEKVAERSVTKETKAAWDQVSGTEYYLVNDKYTSTSHMTNFLAVPKVLDGPEGYLAFEKSMFTMAALEDEYEAKFFPQVPRQVGRDISDYRIFTRDGKDYLETSGFLLLSEKSMEALPVRNEVITVENDGETRWPTSDKIQAIWPVSIRTPECGVFFIYDHSDKEMTCVSSSYMLESGQQITPPKEGRVVFVGEAGSESQIDYH